MNKSTRKLLVGLATLAFLLAGLQVQAAPRPGDVEYGDPWKQDPFGFDFGNHIDTHTQLQLITNKDGDPKKLRGTFYIYFTGEIHEPSGLPVARHPRGYMENADGTVKHDERCGVTENFVCVVGWHMDGHPGVAKFVSHSGVNMNDHPKWLTNRSPYSNPDIPGLAIPQPGSFTHFHWITPSGDDPRAQDAEYPAACDEQMAGKLQGDKIEEAAVDVLGLIKDMAAGDTAASAGWTGQTVHSGLAETSDPTAVASAENVVCPGWYLQINARTNFAFMHGGEIVPVHRGIDNRSHLNLITNHALVPGLTTTRPKDMNGGGMGH